LPSPVAPSTVVRSAYYCEEVASEFDVQGLELDWTGVAWDGDFHHDGARWVHQSFKGSKWQSVNDPTRRLYLKNAYRVILTRARQDMVIVIPKGDPADHTRPNPLLRRHLRVPAKLRPANPPLIAGPASPSLPRDVRTPLPHPNKSGTDYPP